MDQVPLGQTNSQFTKFFEICWYFITSVIIVLELNWLMELRMLVLFNYNFLDATELTRRRFKFQAFSNPTKSLPTLSILSGTYYALPAYYFLTVRHFRCFRMCRLRMSSQTGSFPALDWCRYQHGCSRNPTDPDQFSSSVGIRSPANKK